MTRPESDRSDVCMCCLLFFARLGCTLLSLLLCSLLVIMYHAAKGEPHYNGLTLMPDVSVCNGEKVGARRRARTGGISRTRSVCFFFLTPSFPSFLSLSSLSFTLK